MTFECWFMFPIAICIATVAMGSGVGGATFFAPILNLWLGVPIEVAIGIGLITEVFGFSSGVYAYRKKKLIDYKIALSMLVISIPLALVGGFVSNRFDPNILKGILGLGLLAIAYFLLRSPQHEQTDQLNEQANLKNSKPKSGMTTLTSADGETFEYQVSGKWFGRLVAAVGGFFTGMISTGLGELNSYYLLEQCKIPSKVAVATSVFAVALTALAAATGHLIQFINSGPEVLYEVFSFVIFTVPGVIIGGQIGPAFSSRVPQHVLEKGLGILFILIAALTLGQLLLV